VDTKYKVTPSGRIYLEGVAISQDDREADYLTYVAWLKKGNGPLEIDEIAEKTDAIKVLTDARRFGRQIIDGFMSSALENGANDLGMAGILIKYFADLILALELGSLHGAIEFLDAMLLTPELERPAFPFTSDASLGDIRSKLVGEIGG